MTAWPELRDVPTNRICSDRQAFVLRTIDGIQLAQFRPTEQLGWSWTREQSEVSKCELILPPEVVGSLSDITPWLHWLDCWDDSGQTLYWSGPVVRAALNRQRLSLSARDAGALMSRTRCPLEKRWDSADPNEVGGELWAAMLAHHNLAAEPIVRPDPHGQRYDFNAAAADGDMDVHMGRLTDLGARWTVIAGIPILGPVNLKATTALGVEHFVGDAVEVVRDGAAFCNDVLLRAAGAKAYGRVRAGGLQLQKTVTIDSIDGVSNADRAAQLYAQYLGRVRTEVTMPSGAVLHPEAPVGIDQLMPSARINVDAYGLLVTTEVQQVTVTAADGHAQVAVKLRAVDDDLPELLTVESGGGTDR